MSAMDHGGTSHDVSVKLLSSEDWLLLADQFWIQNWFPPDIQLGSSASSDNQLLSTLEIGISLNY